MLGNLSGSTAAGCCKNGTKRDRGASTRRPPLPLSDAALPRYSTQEEEKEVKPFLVEWKLLPRALRSLASGPATTTVAEHHIQAHKGEASVNLAIGQ